MVHESIMHINFSSPFTLVSCSAFAGRSGFLNGEYLINHGTMGEDILLFHTSDKLKKRVQRGGIKSHEF